MNKQLTLVALGFLAFSAHVSAEAFLNSEDARNLQAITVDSNAPIRKIYASSLTCDQCIRSGYVFCIKAAERYEVTGYTPSADPESKCCQDKFCSEASDSSWSCSSTYSDPLNARAVCPFKTRFCGNYPQTLFTKAEQKFEYKSIVLPLGESCVFETRSTCGLPSFSVNVTDGLDIQYIQFDDRDSTIGSRLLQANLDQMIRRLNKTVEIASRPSQNKYSYPTNQAYLGSGERPPYAGRYDKAQGGKVMFDQGSQTNQQGGSPRSPSDPLCRGRNMVVVVTNVNENSARILQSTTTVATTITFQSENFKSSSAFIIKTGVMVLSLLSLMSFF